MLIHARVFELLASGLKKEKNGLLSHGPLLWQPHLWMALAG